MTEFKLYSKSDNFLIKQTKIGYSAGYDGAYL